MMVNQMLKNENFMVFHFFGGIARRWRISKII
jgi:hypothetical protein